MIRTFNIQIPCYASTLVKIVGLPTGETGDKHDRGIPIGDGGSHVSAPLLTSPNTEFIVYDPMLVLCGEISQYLCATVHQISAG